MLPRLLVLVNVSLSVGLLAWALTLASNRLDWVDAKTDTGTVKGQITLLKEEIDRSVKGAADLSKAYADRALAAAEAFRTGRQGGYAARLQKARGGTFLVPVSLPDSPAYTDLARDGGPEKGPDGKTLRGTNTIQADIDAQVRAGNRAQQGDAPLPMLAEADLDAALADDPKYAALTEKLGFSDFRKLQTTVAGRMADADRKVLKQKDIRLNLRDEAAVLAAGRVNWRAQLQDLLDRQGQLTRRLGSLEGR